MFRAWMIFSCLTLGVLFRVFSEKTEEYFHIFNGKPFLFSDRLLDKHSYTYFFMELVSAIGIGSCLLVQDNTPKYFIRLFMVILVLDLLHYILWMRDEGPGWNIIKCTMFAIPLFYVELPRLWIRLKQSIK